MKKSLNIVLCCFLFASIFVGKQGIFADELESNVVNQETIVEEEFNEEQEDNLENEDEELVIEEVNDTVDYRNGEIIESDSISSEINYILYDNGILEFSGFGTIAYDYSDESHIIDSYLDVKTIVINEGITGIECKAFKDFKSLENIIMPNTIEKIGPNAFENCISLLSINIPDSVKKIIANRYCDSPFYGCNSNLELEIKHIDNNFGPYWNYISETEKISIVSEEMSDDFYVEPSFDSYEEEYWRALDTNQAEIIIPEGITYIPDGKFNGNEILTEIQFPSTLVKIGDYAFNNCINLKDVNIPNGVKSIGVYAFYNCFEFTRIILPKSLEVLGKFAYTNIKKTKYVIIPSLLTSLEDHVFEDNRAIEYVCFEPNSKLSKIDKSALRDCWCLKAVFIPKTVETINADVIYVAFQSKDKNFTLYVEKSEDEVNSIVISHEFNKEGEWSYYWKGNAKHIVYNSSIDDYCKALGLDKTYSIQFDGNNSTSGFMNTIKNVKPLDFVTLTSNKYSRDGAKFINWNTSKDGSGISYPDDGILFYSPRINEEKTILYAQWQKELYTITYNLNGGINTKTNINKYDVDTEFIFESPFRKGYIFLGWFDNKDNKIEKININTTGNLELTAKWEVANYKISFDANGGILPADYLKGYITYTMFDGTFNLLSPIKPFKTFVGWYDAKTNKKITSIVKGSTKDYELYAKWSDGVAYTISYDANGGAGKVSNTTVKVNKDVRIKSNSFKLDGKVFKCWNSKQDGSGVNYYPNQIISKTAPLVEYSNDNYVLYAQYDDIKSFDIEYIGNGATTGSMAVQTMSNSKYKKLLTNKYKKDGYIFAGWDNKETANEVVYKNGIQYYGFDGEDGSTVKLYAVWEPISYTISFNANSGKGKMGSISCKYDETCELPLNTMTRKGYEFVGWSTNKKCDYNNVQFLNQDEVLNLTIKNKSKVTMYAIWKPITYSICFAYGEEKTEPIIQTYDQKYSLGIQTIDSVLGKKISKYSYINDSGKLVKSTNFNIKNLSSIDGKEVVLNVESFSNIKYKITYNYNGGKTVDNKKTYYVDTNTFVIKPTSKKGSIFIGWFDENGNRIDVIEKGTYGDIVLNAVFE